MRHLTLCKWCAAPHRARCWQRADPSPRRVRPRGLRSVINPSFIIGPVLGESRCVPDPAVWGPCLSALGVHDLAFAVYACVCVCVHALARLCWPGSDVGTSAGLIQRLLTRWLPCCLDLSFNIVHVDNVAEAHVAALETPEAGGHRFLTCSDETWWMRDVAALLDRNYGPRVRSDPDGC